MNEMKVRPQSARDVDQVQLLELPTSGQTLELIVGETLPDTPPPTTFHVRAHPDIEGAILISVKDSTICVTSDPGSAAFVIQELPCGAPWS